MHHHMPDLRLGTLFLILNSALMSAYFYTSAETFFASHITSTSSEFEVFFTVNPLYKLLAYLLALHGCIFASVTAEEALQ